MTDATASLASPNVGSSNALPATAGKYRLILELGRGGMADVMLGVVEGPGGFHKLQVLKFLRGEFANDPDFCTMFLDEARLSARINHPNVAQTNEVGYDGSRYFIAMEYLEGHSLDELIRRVSVTKLPLPIVLRILADACTGLHFAHELKDFDGTPLNVIHRDVSPHNIFVTYEGAIKLLDFGIAKASDSQSHTEVGTIKGKVAYIAPEQLLAPTLCDRRADIFSVGSILWRIITGKRLWSGATEVEVLHALSKHEIPAPTPLPDTPDELVRICNKAMAADPNDRYATAADLHADLESLIAALGGASYPSVAALVNRAFADRRREVKSRIEARMSTAQTTHVTRISALPRLEPTTTGSVDLESSGGAPPAVMRAPARANWMLVGAAGLVAAALVCAAFIARPPHAVQPAAESSPAPSSVEPTPAPKVESEVMFDVNPPNAQVLVDQIALTGKPPRGTFARDGLEHRVRVQAEGYVPKTLDVKFNVTSIRIGVSLDKERRAAATSPVRSPSKSRATTMTIPSALLALLPPSSATAAPPLAAPPPATTAASIDKDDPWSK